MSGFQNSFTSRFSGKFKIPPHRKRFATLPCETLRVEKLM